MLNHKVLAVITARGGSKRLPKKNLRTLDGQSLLERTIKASINAKSVDRTVLSSDCPEIIKAGIACGCDVPFIRPPELATDDASSEDVLEHAIKKLPFFEWVMLLQPTSPFRTSDDVDLAFKLLRQVNRSSCVGVKRLQSGIELKGEHLFNGEVFSSNGQKKVSSDREFGVNFALNGAIYICKTEFFLRKKKLIGTETVGIEMSAKKSLDIDTLGDLELALALLEGSNEVR